MNKRFTVYKSADNKDVAVWDDDFGYDAALKLTGDFAKMEDKIKYAEAVANALNKADIPVGEE